MLKKQSRLLNRLVYFIIDFLDCSQVLFEISDDIIRIFKSN